MKTIRLPPRLVTQLQAQPESGMGYQVVSAELQSGSVVRPLTVFNCEDLALPDDSGGLRVQDVVRLTVESPPAPHG